MAPRVLVLPVLLFLCLSSFAQETLDYTLEWEVDVPAQPGSWSNKVYGIDAQNTILTYTTYTGWALMKIDGQGVQKWDKAFPQGAIVKVIKGNDNGFIVLTNTSDDAVVIKLDTDGNTVWTKSFGGTAHEASIDIVSIDATSYLLLTSSSSNISGNKTENSLGGLDVWAVKINNSGTKVWDKTTGTALDDSATRILKKDNDFYLVAIVDDHQTVTRITTGGTVSSVLNVTSGRDIFARFDFSYVSGEILSTITRSTSPAFVTFGPDDFKIIHEANGVPTDIFSNDIGTGGSEVQNFVVLADNRIFFSMTQGSTLFFDGASIKSVIRNGDMNGADYGEAIGMTSAFDLVSATGTIGSEAPHLKIRKWKAPNFFVPVYYKNQIYAPTYRYFLNLFARWADYTNDGRLDLIVGKTIEPSSGATGNIHLFTTQTTGAISFDKTITFDNLSGPPWNFDATKVAIGDYNHDGWIDFLHYTYLYTNNKNKTFTASAFNVPNANLTNWGDVDQDGDYDLFRESNVGALPVLVNNGSGTFVARAALANEELNYGDVKPSGAMLHFQKHLLSTQGDGGDPFSMNAVDYGDYDRDGDNDALMYNGQEVIVYENRSATPNVKPSTPTNLSQAITGSNVQFNWSASTDDHTAPASLSYNVYLRRDLDTLISFNSFRKTGVRKIPTRGNALTNTYTFKGLTVGTYYWSAQSIDGDFAGSTFADEKQFFVTNNPTNIALSSATIAENSLAAIGNLTTTDADGGETHTYTLVGGTGSTDNALFKITGASLSALSATSLNFESKSLYSIRLRTTDSRQGFFEKTFTITVTNVQEVATNIDLTASTIIENLPMGTSIGTLSNNDPDNSDIHTFTLVDGTGDTDNASFEIVGTTLKSKAIFNFEIKTSYSIRVKTSDQASNSFQKNFTVTIIDVNDLSVPSVEIEDPTQTSFLVSWNAIEGATAYQLEISTDDFLNLLPGYNPKTLATTSISVQNLSPGTIYDIRVRATKGSDHSGYSPTANQITVPPDPGALDPIQVNPTGFTAAWSSSTGADFYQLEVSVGGDGFVPMEGYNPMIVTNALDKIVEDLSPGTTYKYRVRAVNSAGPSGNSNEKPVPTTIPEVLPKLKITTAATTGSVDPSALPATATVTVTDGTGERTVTMWWRPILSKNYESTPATVHNANDYRVNITSEMIDELGIEYYFEATDDLDAIEQEDHSFLYASVNASLSPAIPFAGGFDGKAATYQMFSIPYQLADDDINRMFDLVLGTVEKTKWRLYHYANGENHEYPKDFQEFKPGEGYWFNTVLEDRSINIKGASVVKANQLAPFKMTLVAGWNQVGNPYPFSISWSEVKGASNKIGSLNFYGDGNYSKQDEFEPWKGALVHVSENMILDIPLTARSDGRLASSIVNANLDAEEWLLPLFVKSGDLGQEGGIGMNPEASISKDRFDDITVPRFIDYVEFNTHHDEFIAPKFSTDVVTTIDHYEWEFNLQSNTGQPATITWNLGDYQHAQSSLLLIDPNNGTWVDMKNTTYYTFTANANRPARIVFDRSGETTPGITIGGHAWPNPFSSRTTFPVLVGDDNSSVEVAIMDMLGRKLKTISADIAKAGAINIEWDGRDQSGNAVAPGTYFYRTYASGNSISVVRRIVKQ